MKALWFLVAVGLLVTGQEGREPSTSWMHLYDPLDVDYTCNIPRAFHPSNAIKHFTSSGSKRAQQRYLVWGRGEGPRGGLGNDFVFWPAVFVSSLLSGRIPVIDDISQPIFKVSAICKRKYLDCQIPLLSSIDIDEVPEYTPSSRDKITSSTVREALTSTSQLVRVTGYHRHSNWWTQNQTQAACVRKILNCTDIVALQRGGRDICVERAAMTLLAGRGAGIGLRPFASSLVSRLKVGVKGKDQSAVNIQQKILTYLQEGNINEIRRGIGDEDESRIFGTAVHMRFQFPSVEVDGFTEDERSLEATEWMTTEKNRKLIDLLWNVTMSNNAGGGDDANANTNIVQNNYTLMFISADSELMKEKLFQETLERGIKLYAGLVPVYLPIHSNLTHLRHFEDIEIGADDQTLPSIIFDWLMTSQGQQVVSYRGVHSHFQSTFSLSAAMYGAPIIFCDKAKHFIFKGKRLVFQRKLPHVLDNF